MSLSDMISDMEDIYKKTLDYLQGICSKREYCSSDIFRKALTRMEGDGEKAQELMERLKTDRFVDDLRYASAFAREKSEISGWGRHKISARLLSKGIDRSTIEKALGEVNTDKAEDKMIKAIEARWKVLSDDPQGKFKLIRFALSRGYDYGQIRSAIESITRG